MVETKTQQHKEPQQQEKHSPKSASLAAGVLACLSVVQRGLEGPGCIYHTEFNCICFRAGWPIVDMHLENGTESEDRSQPLEIREFVCVCLCACVLCEALQMKGLEGPGYMYIYIYIYIIVYFRAGWPILCHTQRCVCGITDRLDGPFHKGGKGEDGTGRGQDRAGGGGIGVVWGGGVGLCVGWGGVGWGIKQTQKCIHFWVGQPISVYTFGADNPESVYTFGLPYINLAPKSLKIYPPGV